MFRWAAVKVVLYLALFAVVVSCRPVRRMWLELDPLRRTLLGMLVLLILVGQIVAKKYPTYPFVKWGMYDTYSERVTYYEYHGVRADGSEEPFPIAHLVRTHSSDHAVECPTCGKRLLWRMRGLGNDRRKARKGPERRAIRDLYERTLRSAWQVYRERHPDAEFERVDVWKATFEVGDYVDVSSIRRKRLWTVPLGDQGDDGAGREGR